jgi:hypothetical protein
MLFRGNSVFKGLSTTLLTVIAVMEVPTPVWIKITQVGAAARCAGNKHLTLT